MAGVVERPHVVGDPRGLQRLPEVAGVSAASIDVTGIIAGYAHLRLVLQARGDAAVTTTSLLVRFNNDSAANYDSQSQALRTTNANSAAAAATSIAIQSSYRYV
jgi:hypothetical protein